MKSFLVFSIITLFLASCSGSADKKVPQLANEMCDCFQSFDKDLSPAGKELFQKMIHAENPQSVLQKGIAALPADESKQLVAKIQSLTNKDSEVFKCITAFDERNKHETIKDRKDFTQKIFQQMKVSGACTTGTAMMALSLYKLKK